MNIRFVLNGAFVSAKVGKKISLLNLLREQLGLTGAKEGCGIGRCGSCTVIVDGIAVSSCVLPAWRVDGTEVLTIEGLAKGGELDTLQRSFIENNAVQCGFCTPGMIMRAKALLMKNPDPSEDEIREAISRNLCRCTGYINIVKAIRSAAETKT
jgi:carbon-monoxide dehydrogenase small subunit